MSKEPLSREEAPTEPTAEPPQTIPATPAPPNTEPMPSVLLGQVNNPSEALVCDVCDSALPVGEDDDDAPGHGLYVWVRHGQVVYEEPPLCATCASAITLSALRRWDMEEEEG